MLLLSQRLAFTSSAPKTFLTPALRCISRRSSSFTITNSLDPSAALAVTQQTVAFAAVVGAEAAFTGLNTPADTPGRPSIPTTLIGVGGIVAAAVLISQGGAPGGIGCGTAVGTSAFLMWIYFQRFKDTPYNPNDWPGAKTWPAVMMLITFFEIAASTQGLLDALSLLRQP